MLNKSVYYGRFGPPAEVLEIRRTPVVPPGPGEIRVRMLARPINPSDLIPVRGAYAHRIALPAVPGYEGVGIVEETGPSVPPGLLGRRVLPLRGEGTWQESVLAPAGLAIPVPPDIPDETAAQLYINPVTAWAVCGTLRLKYGDTLVVNAGGSAIGRVFAQLAAVFNYELIAVTRSAAHTEELLRLGAAHVIDTAGTPLREAVLSKTGGRGATAAVDSIGGPDGAALAGCVRAGGTVYSIGLLSGVPADWAAMSRLHRVNARPFWLRHWIRHASAADWIGTFEEIIELVRDGRLSLMKIAAGFGLDEVHAAVAAFESGVPGKILLTGKASEEP
ncbi:zinc-dependent alcohol dehydrogenase family protein [Paenibacillus chitinolyticus]|uniref:zinc-dependent alcohol dehydrogenase family protein n=1 Tax=Paenibacillus chitinolyticus TaxID=79263 RepID=UPI00386DC4BF